MMFLGVFLLWMLWLFVVFYESVSIIGLFFSRAVMYDVRTLIGVALNLWKSFGKPFCDINSAHPEAWTIGP